MSEKDSNLGEHYRYLGGLVRIYNWDRETLHRIIDFAEKRHYPFYVKGIQIFGLFIGRVKGINKPSI